MESRLEASKKRKIKSEAKESNSWECSACTFVNKLEDYKCAVCETRKGTSTRKPRLTNDIIEQQQFIAKAIVKDEDKRKRATNGTKNFEKSNPLQFKVFANGFEVTITEFKPKSSSIPNSPAISNCSSSIQGFINSDLNQPSPSSSDAASFTHISQPLSSVPSESGTVDSLQKPLQNRKRGRRRKVPVENEKNDLNNQKNRISNQSQNDFKNPVPQSPTVNENSCERNILDSPPSSVESTTEIIPEAKKPLTVPSLNLSTSQPMIESPARSILNSSHPSVSSRNSVEIKCNVPATNIVS